METIQNKLSHNKFVTYLQGESDTQLNSEIKKLCREDPAYNLLFELIDDIRMRAKGEIKPVANTEYLTWAAIEGLLIKLVSGNSEPEEDQLFLGNLIKFSNFYYMLLQELSQIASIEEVADINQLIQEQVTMKSDEELLEMVNSRKARYADSVESNASTTRAKLTNLPTVINKNFYYIGGIAAVVAILFFLYKSVIPSFPGDGKWDNSPPYNFTQSKSFLTQGSADNSGFRSRSNDSAELFEAIQQRMMLSYTAYQACDYKGVIEKVEGWNSHVSELYSQVINKDSKNLKLSFIEKSLKLVQEYYFYMGIVYQSYSRSGDLDNESSRDEYLNRAIRFLNEAEHLATKHAIVTDDREKYFLGLAFTFKQDSQSAIEQFRQIAPQSQFYQPAIKIMEEISKL